MSGEAEEGAHLLLEEAHLLLGGAVSLHQLHGNLVDSIHEGFVDHAESTFTEPTLPAFSVPADPDVVPATRITFTS